MMYVAILLYLTAYVFSVRKVIKLSRLAILRAQDASLNALSQYISTQPSGPLYSNLAGDIKDVYDAVQSGTRRACLLNMTYLCPMIVLFSVLDNQSFTRTYIDEYTREVMLELEHALRDKKISDTFVDLIANPLSKH